MERERRRKPGSCRLVMTATPKEYLSDDEAFRVFVEDPAGRVVDSMSRAYLGSRAVEETLYGGHAARVDVGRAGCARDIICSEGALSQLVWDTEGVV